MSEKPPRPLIERQPAGILPAARCKRKRKRREVELTLEIGRIIVTAIAAGNFPSIARQLANVSADTLDKWLKRGARGEQPYADFAEAYRGAEIKVEATLVEVWKDAAPGDWRAAKEFLARRYPQRWSDQADQAANLDGAGRLAAAGFVINIHLGNRGEEWEDEQRAIDVTPIAVEAPPPPKDPDPNPDLN
jgi:hypothetical protein